MLKQRPKLAGLIPAFLAPFFFLTSVMAVESPQIPAGLAGKKLTLSQYEGTAVRAFMTARDVKNLPEGNVLAQDFTLTTFNGGPTNVEAVIETPECIVNLATRLTWSTNRLRLYNAQTNLFIEGRAFSWQPGPTNILTISNDVHTVIERITNAPMKNTGALHIYSDHFKFLAVLASNANTRIAYYTDHVRAEDPEVRLTSDTLTVDVSGTNSVKNIIGDGNVVIVNKADNSQATGEHAVYVNEDGRQIVELSGNPFWHDAKNEGKARLFRFDRNSRKIWLMGDAQMKLPRSSVAQPDLLGLNGDKKNFDPAKTNDPITVSADTLSIDLATNKSGRVMVGKKNVVILADNTKATADSAFFSEASGVLRLTNGTWGGDQFTAKGELLTFDRSNKVFHAENAAYLKLPTKSFGDIGGTKALTTPAPKKDKKSKPAETGAIEILSSNYDVTTNVAVFRGGVNATFPGQDGHGTLTCDTLTARFRNNKLEKLIAQGHVDLQQTTKTTTNISNQHVTCETLTMNLRTNGTTESIVAEHNVIGEEISQNLATKKQTRKKLSASNVDMRFAATTNLLERMVADKNVYIEHDRSWAQGDQIIYTNNGVEEVAELLGHPKGVMIREGHSPIPLQNEDGVVWDLKNDVIRGKGKTKATVTESKKK